jgi:spoIIIJ-associated protein
MKDQVFGGVDVEAAVAAASQALGIQPASLRYVVLEAGRPGGLGLQAVPARIAVLGFSRPAVAAPLAAPAPAAAAAANAPEGDPRAGLRGVVRALAEVSGLDLSADVAESGEGLVLHLAGPGCELLLEEDGEVLRSFEYLLQRTFRGGGRLRVECEGYRGRREDSLRAQARELAAAVRADGLPRTTAPLNSYERRLIHVALTDDPDLTTFSVGEGPDRKVTIARRSDAPEG